MDIWELLGPIKTEEQRDHNFLHLTANEAQMSQTAREFLNSKLSERYFFGSGENNIFDDGAFAGLGLPGIANLITAAEDATKEMLHASIVNLNCLSGVHAMMCAILSTTEPGDTVMTLRHQDGGHFATPGILERVGRKHIYAIFDTEKLSFNAQETAKLFHESQAKAFYMDVSYYINPHNLQELREAIGKDAIIIYDASHTMGLILGQTFQAPLLEGADVICANTHKTLPGPQKGMIAFKDAELGEKANAIINGCLYSSPHTHHMIALATTLLEMKEFGHAYATQVIKNSNALAEAMVSFGYTVRKTNTGNYSENHQVHVFLKDNTKRHEVIEQFIQNNISTNLDTIFGSPFIRLGTQEITRRGMQEEDMKIIARLLHDTMVGQYVKGDVISFNQRFPHVLYSFDK